MAHLPTSRLRIREGKLINVLRNLPDISQDLKWATYGISKFILLQFLGLPWMERHNLGGRSRDLFISEKRGDSIDFSAETEKIFKVIQLAEHLYNLQRVENFAECLRKIKDGIIEDTSAELEAGKLLRNMGIPFRYRKISGITREDYDLEFFVPDFGWIPGEVKNKASSTIIGKSTIESSLKAARKQLPTDRPNVIFLRVPSSWLVDATGTVIPKAIIEFFVKTQGVYAVILYSSIVNSMDSIDVMHNMCGIHINKNCRFKDILNFKWPSPSLAVPLWNDLSAWAANYYIDEKNRRSRVSSCLISRIGVAL
jgi:hypothetical protein